MPSMVEELLKEAQEVVANKPSTPRWDMEDRTQLGVWGFYEIKLPLF